MRICTIEFRTTNPQSEIRNPQLPSRFRCPRAPIAPRWTSRPSCAQPGSCARSSTAPWCDSTGPTSSVGCGRRGKCWSWSIACPRSVPDPSRRLAGGALAPWTKPRYEGRRRILREAARASAIPFDAPWRDLPERDRHFLLHGARGRFLGMFPFLVRLEAKRYKQYIRVFLRQYQLAKTCPACGGARLKPEALAVKVGDQTIAAVAGLTAGAIRDWISGLTLTQFQSRMAPADSPATAA